MTALKIMITGGAGFVGLHLTRMLRELFPVPGTLISTSKTACSGPDGITIEALDVNDRKSVDHQIKRVRPSHLIHLAGLASVAGAQQDIDAAWNINLSGTLNLAHAILTHAPDCTMIFAGSAEVYGLTAKSVESLDENSLLAPITDYGATKAAADIALGAMAFHGLKLIRFRPFNHTGPGQSDQFVIPSFAGQIAKIEAGLQPPIINVGNLDAQRDFLDVRDVASAYGKAIERSQHIPNGTVMNLASGVPQRIGDMLNYMITLSNAKIDIAFDPIRQRPSEIPRYVGNADLAKRLLNWEPTRSIRQSLVDVLEYARTNVV